MHDDRKTKIMQYTRLHSIQAYTGRGKARTRNNDCEIDILKHEGKMNISKHNAQNTYCKIIDNGKALKIMQHVQCD